MKRFAFLAMAILTVTFVLSSEACAFADETVSQQSLPYLNSIDFKNAVIDAPFSTDVTDYTMTLTDNSITPTLSSYSIGGDANIFVTYSYDETNHQTGIVATLEYANGSKIYDFVYRNPAQYDVNNENHLSTIYCTYGEIKPSINDNKSSYTLYIPSDMTEIKLTPVTKNVNAYATELNMKLSETQEPELKVPVTASDGSKRIYSIKVKRVDKTTKQVQNEMKKSGYTSFVPEEKFYENTTFKAAAIASICGIVAIILLFLSTRRITVDVFDKDEKPFFAEK